MFADHSLPPAIMLLAGLLIGLLLGVIATSAIFYPPLAKAMARAKAAALLAIGLGLLTWGITTLATGSEFHQPFRWNIMRSSIECIAWGSGITVAGILSLVMGFVGFVPQPRD